MIIATDDVEVMKKAVVAHASSLWEGLLFKMEDWLMKPYQDIQAMFWFEDVEEYRLRIKELEAENVKLSNRLLQQTLQEIKEVLPVDEETPLGVGLKDDAGDEMAGFPLAELGIKALEENIQIGTNLEELADQFQLVKTHKSSTKEPSDQSVEGGGLPL